VTGSNHRRAATRLVLPIAAILLAAGCGASAGTVAPSTAPTQFVQDPTPVPSQDDAGGGDTGNPGASGAGGGPIGGDFGDRSKGSVQATVAGGYAGSIDLPFGAPAARFELDGDGTAYLPYTDPVQGTLFLTITGHELLVQYAGPDNVGLSNGATPCELKVDSLDASEAKGSFTCKGMFVVKGDVTGSADMTGTFEGHR